ncbi:MAG: hypothetical protein IPM23_25950 [Candidatus Melainabacteria bacterium]|nr:hypothetical protein [Candidatus Melainabacteria bacterium]
MGSINTLDLRFADGAIAGGAAFRLNSASPCNADISTPDHRCILKNGAIWAVVEQLRAPVSWDDLLEDSYEAAQQMLDIVATEQRYFLSLPSAHNEYIIWRRPGGRTTVRLGSAVFQPLGLDVSITATDANGNPIALPPPPPTQWHESMRYFRYSQIRDDVYVAYRDAYLALEAIISHLYPLNPGERELDWLNRACQALQATGMSFDDFVAVPTADNAAAFVQEQYRANRTAVFHAKQSKAHVVPGNLTDRKTVSAALDFLGKFVVEAIRRSVAPGISVPVFTLAAFRKIIDGMQDLVLAVSPDATPVNVSDTEVSPAGAPVTALNTRYEGPYSPSGYDYSFLGTIPVANMSDPLICTKAAYKPEGLMTRGNIEALSVDGADDFEYRFVWTFAQRARLQADFEL